MKFPSKLLNAIMVCSHIAPVCACVCSFYVLYCSPFIVSSPFSGPPPNEAVLVTYSNVGFEIILEDLHACPLENLLLKLTSVNFRKSDTYPSKSNSFHWDTEIGVFQWISAPLFIFSLVS